MRLHFPACATAVALAAISLAGQQQQQQQAGQQQQQAGQQQQQAGPHPKSQKEVDALKKVQADQQAQNWDAEITDINYVLENFADTEYKNMLLAMAIQAAQN
jgi:hypothetical protein